MALSVRQPQQQHQEQSPPVEHYLVLQTTPAPDSKDKAAGTGATSPATLGGGRMKLECSDHTFDNILSLIYHYCTVK